MNPGRDVGHPREGGETKGTFWGDIHLRDGSKQCPEHPGSGCPPRRRPGGHLTASTAVHPWYHWTPGSSSSWSQSLSSPGEVGLRSTRHTHS